MSTNEDRVEWQVCTSVESKCGTQSYPSCRRGCNREALEDGFRNENAAYVPSFFAAAIIGENPQTFGLQTPPLSTLADTNASK
jgi:hypothetical protein